MITAEDFLLNKVRGINYKQPNPKQFEEWLIHFAKLHVEQALKEASENADTIYRGDSFGDYIVDKNSILNCYPPENIK